MIDYKAPIIPGGHFTWGEYAMLKEWGRHAQPNQKQIVNAIRFFTRIEPVRIAWEKHLRAMGHKDRLGWAISSGGRTNAYTQYLRNKGIPAAMASAHLDWCAVDLVPQRFTWWDLWQFMRPLWKGRLEHSQYTKGWVHADDRLWGQSKTFIP